MTTSRSNDMFRWKDRARQLIDFSSLCYGNKHPTDIDGAFDDKGKRFLLFELKYNGKPMDTGQRLCLEHMIDAFYKAGYKGVALLCDHYVEDTSEVVDAGASIVRASYYSWRGWKDATCQITLKDYIERFFKIDS